MNSPLKEDTPKEEFSPDSDSQQEPQPQPQQTQQDPPRQRRYGIRPLGRTRSEGVPIHTRRRTMSVDLHAQGRIDTFDGGGGNILEEDTETGKSRFIPPPVRRLSDLKALTTTLGLHIHGSLLSLAGNYDKARKQVLSLFHWH